MNWVTADRQMDPWTYEGPEDAYAAFGMFADAMIGEGTVKSEAREFIITTLVDEYTKTGQLTPNSPWEVRDQAVEKFGSPVTPKQIIQDAPIKGHGSKWLL
jgi:hypothetical protein